VGQAFRPASRARAATGRPGLHVSVTDAHGRPVRAPGLAGWLARVAPASARGALSIALVSDARMRRLSARFRGVDRATDVLAFPAGDPGSVGDVAIATGVARRQARRAGHPLATELRVLALHGLLHLLGYDHERDRGEMARVERRLRRRGGLREGLVAKGASR
jgi:probable rRNA maturation factor